ncbi:MAG: class I SAM-dependent methyltransferase [Planctomycetia bacterium]|nr:class I SAM-dependent methyltransferase [Planctomycetia bacterium]
MKETEYEILDFGNGRKLERLGGRLLDRPSPPAEGFRTAENVSRWQQAEGKFRRSDGLKGRWQWRGAVPKSWVMDTGIFRLELKPTEVGHLGVFPEQWPNWEWIYTQTREFLARRESFRVLNLFAYTGGSTLASASAMKECGLTSEEVERFCTVHVDSAKNIVQWARGNAEISGMENCPIRWIGEDALRFVLREVKRGRKYHAVILDPPSYGHGTRGEVWKLDQHLPELLEACAELMTDGPGFVLLTAHSPGLDARGMGRMLERYFPGTARCETYSMQLRTASGRVLPSGEAARLVWR